MLRTVNGIAVRQLRNRPLRARLTAFGVVLGVGMVFGVLLLLGTIRHTFDDLIGSAWGKTDLIVSGTANGILPESALTTARAMPGVRDAGPMVGGDFTRLDPSGKAVTGPAGRLLVAGYDTTGMPPYDFRWVEGRQPRSGPELAVEHNWARERGIDVGDHIRLATPAGPVELPVIGIFRFSSGLSFGGSGFAAMPMAPARRLTGIPKGYMQISVAVDDKGDIEAMQAKLAAAFGKGAQVEDARGLRRRGRAAAQRAQCPPLVLLRHRAVRGRVPDPERVQHDRPAADARDRHAAHPRRHARAGHADDPAGGAVIGGIGSVLGLGLGLGLAEGLIALMRSMEMPVGAMHVTAGPAVAAVSWVSS